MKGCPDSAACALACCMGEVSQHPMCPHWAHRRRCTHQPPAASHSTHPLPLGGTDVSMPAISLIQLSFAAGLAPAGLAPAGLAPAGLVPAPPAARCTASGPPGAASASF